MINVNELIQQAFQKCSLVGDGQSATGTQAKAALNDLNSLLAELSSQNYLASTPNQATVKSSGRIVVSKQNCTTHKSYEGFNQDFEDNPSKYQPGQVVYIEDSSQYYYITTYNSSLAIKTSKQFNVLASQYKLNPDVVSDNIPDRLVSCARLIGNRYVSLYPASIQALDTSTKMSLATAYTSSTKHIHFTYDEVDINIEQFVVEFNSIKQATYKLTWLESFPKLNLDSTLWIDSKYESLIEDGLALKLCKRYKLTDSIQMFANDFNESKALVKRINRNNRPLTYDECSKGYLDGFYDGLAGNGW